MISTTVRTPRPGPVRTRAWPRDLAVAACWISTGVVGLLWLGGGQARLLLSSPADQLTALGRLAGLAAADLLLIQVLLMARVPWIERAYGQDALARRHRLVGSWSFGLLIAHVALITVGYTLADHSDVLHETWTLLSSYAGMLLAYAAALALTVVAVTSLRRARRRLRYESWHLLHLYAYVGVGLSIPHEIWTGQDFTSSTAAQVYWWSSYGLAAAAVVVFRVGLPLMRTLRHGITVTSVTRETADVVTVRMGGRGLHRLGARAGQFFVWRFLDGPGWSRGHPYSLSARPRHDRIQITAKDLGDGSERLSGLRPGTRVLLEGPYGALTGAERTCERLALLACGIGITPLRALLEDLDFPPGAATLIYRVHSRHDVVFRAELDALARRRGVRMHILEGPRAARRPSWLPEALAHRDDVEVLRELVTDLTLRDVFVCGPDGWMDAALDAARRAGVPAGQLHAERFTW